MVMIYMGGGRFPAAGNWGVLQALLTELERADAIRDDVRDKILALLSAHYGAVVVDFEI